MEVCGSCAVSTSPLFSKGWFHLGRCQQQSRICFCDRACCLFACFWHSKSNSPDRISGGYRREITDRPIVSEVL